MLNPDAPEFAELLRHFERTKQHGKAQIMRDCALERKPYTARPEWLLAARPQLSVVARGPP